MELFEAISRRKSCRKYKKQPLGEERLNEIKTAIEGFVPLYPDNPLDFRFVHQTKGMFHVSAPQYLIVSGQGKEGEKENAGFLYEQLVLWLDVHELGSVWLGKAREAGGSRSGNDIITIAFGEADEPIHRSESEYRRKAFAEITNAPEDACIQAARLAPSGMNLQPWFFEKRGGRLVVYEQIIKPPISLAYKLTALDMGIALCHYALACKHYGKPFSFERKRDASDKKGYRLFGEIALL